MKRKILAVLAGIALAVGMGAAPAFAAGPYYYYAGGNATAVAHTGIYNAMDIYSPTVNTAKGDLHSVVEMLVKNPTTNDTIEFGWRVEPATGISTPQLFTFLWGGGTALGYNTGLGATPAACGLTSFSGTIGAAIPGTFPQLKKFGIAHSGTWPSGWWYFAYDTGWAGCVPDSYLSAYGFTNFGSFTFTQTFGEFTSTHSLAAGTAPCGQMGSGVNPATTVTGAQRAANAVYDDNTFPVYSLFTQTNDGSNASAYYNTAPLGTTGKSFYLGGTGKQGITPPC